MTALHIRALDKQADTTTFSCGQSALDGYIHRYASQDVRRNVARVFIACPQDAPQSLAGYYTLSASNVQCTGLPAAIARKLPQYPIPVALLGRLAVATAFQGQGVGSVLLVAACKKILQAQEMLAVAGLVVDAKDNHAASFYKHLGFTPLNQQAQRLFLPMQVLQGLAG
jgi:ribosomal protein S18 acetylase RimI-like enzyme